VEPAQGVFVKKLCLVLVLAAVAVGVWAQEQEQPKKGGFSLSAGVGGYFTSDFRSGAESTEVTAYVKVPYSGGGGFVFFDATYAELSVGFFGGGGKYTQEDPSVGKSEYDSSYIGLDIGLLGKYPFAIGKKLALFPLLGVGYRVMLSAKVDGKEWDDAGDFSALWIRFGGGADYAITPNIYVRLEALYGFQPVATEFAKDNADFYRETSSGGAKALYGEGLDVKLAAGYKF
jgi:hypothetical protein